MKKIFVGLMAMVFAVGALAQTFPVNNLQVNGNSTFAGSAAFATIPTAPTPAFGDSSTKVATTAFVSSALSTATPTVGTNTALQALATTTTNQVWRIGFSVAGDAPPLLYTASNAVCSLNAGAGDNGSQVKSADNLCWIANFSPNMVDVREWGAKADGVTDSTTAMQAAHNTGKMVYYPTGIFLFTTLTIAKGGIAGDGQWQSILQSNDTTTADLITFTGTGQSTPAFFRNFTILGTLSKTSGAALRFNASSGELAFANMTNMGIQNVPNGVWFTNSSHWVLTACNIVNYSLDGIHIENTNNSDSGDSSISDTYLNTAVPGGSTFGIRWLSSGGLKVVNTKVLGGNSGFVVAFTGTSNTADIFISNSSFENMNNFGIFLGRNSGTSHLGSVLINNCEFAVNVNVGIGTDNSGFLTLLTINSNIISLGTTVGTGISLNNVANFLVGSNVISASAGTGTTTGISVNATSSNGIISPNTFVGLAGNISNASATTFVVNVP